MGEGIGGGGGREVQNNRPSVGEYGHFLELQNSPTNKAPEFFKRLTQLSIFSAPTIAFLAL